jgi:hypothetical protein
LYAFFGFVDAYSPWFMEDFDDNVFVTYSHVEGDTRMSTRNLEGIEAYRPGIEAAWSTIAQLCEAAELVIQEA